MKIFKPSNETFSLHKSQSFELKTIFVQKTSELRKEEKKKNLPKKEIPCNEICSHFPAQNHFHITDTEMFSYKIFHLVFHLPLFLPIFFFCLFSASILTTDFPFKILHCFFHESVLMFSMKLLFKFYFYFVCVLITSFPSAIKW